MGAKIAGLGILLFFVFIMVVFALFRKDLDRINDLGGDLGGSISYYDRTGKVLLWQDYEAVKRVPVGSSEISDYMKQATVATEDRGFYTEPGFSVKGILRAAINNTIHRNSRQGGSTITEQLVKMSESWTENRTLARKIKELILAVDVERNHTKDEILTAYLNMAPYGGVDYGVQVAANDYFRTSAKKLTLPQAAMLAAIPKSPSYYSPYGPYYDKQALKYRYDYVLDSMVETRYITQDQADAAKKVDVASKISKQRTKYAGIRDPYFVLAAKNQILSQVLKGEDNSTQVDAWKVTTTMDVGLQNLATSLVKKNLPLIKAYNGDVTAFVAEDVKTGQMVSLVGGVDFNAPGYGQINYAQWPISPGSSFKPYDYATFIENNNAGAGSVLYDRLGPLPGYPCTNRSRPPPVGNGNCLNNYDFRSPGPITLRYALGGSRNIPAVKAMLSADPNDSLATDPLRVKSVNKVIDTANDLMAAPNAYKCFADNAMTKPTQCYGSAALGDGAFFRLDQHVNGLASLARLGQAIPTTYILNIQDANGKQIYSWRQPQASQVVRPETAYIVNDMLSDPRASYLGGSCTSTTCTPQSAGGHKWQRYNGWHIAVKTGTTGNNYDGLMTGWSTQYATAMWVGHHTRSRPLTITNDVLTEPVIRTWMQTALDKLNKKPVNWIRPSGVQVLPAYVVRNHVGFGSLEPSPSMDIYPSWYKPRTAASASSTTDKVSGLLATDCTPAAARQTYSGSSGANAFTVDIFYGAGIATNTASQDNIHSCSDTLPSISSLSVTSLGNGKYQLSASAAAGTHPLSGGGFGGTIAFTINGRPVAGCPSGCSFAISGGSVNKTFTYTGSSGTYNIVAAVSDSVLYQATSTYPNVKLNKSADKLKFAAPVYSTGTLTVKWSGGVGPYTATSAALSCTAAAGSTSCQITGAPPSGSISIQDSTGATVTGSY